MIGRCAAAAAILAFLTPAARAVEGAGPAAAISASSPKPAPSPASPSHPLAAARAPTAQGPAPEGVPNASEATKPAKPPARVRAARHGRGPTSTLAGQHPDITALVETHAKATGVPAALIHHVITRESRYNPRAVGPGGVFGLMQIKPGTARALGYSGSAAGLLDPETNLTYGVRYLAGAYKVANGDPDRAYGFFRSGYYYQAKRRGLLKGQAQAEAVTASPTARPVPLIEGAAAALAEVFSPLTGQGPDPSR